MSTPDRPVMFRAGRLAGEAASAVLDAVPEAVAGTGAATYLADVSEFQPDVADAAYLAWSRAIIIRAAYGDAHADKAWYGGQRRELLLQGGAKFLGIYQYLVAGQDAAAQARALVSIVGPRLNKGEMIIADLEEGSGNQAARLSAWASVIRNAYGIAPWSYSGLSFAGAHGIAPVTWLADYTGTEPASPRHVLWQFTDAYNVPGVGTCDCSVYRGTIDQLAALAYGGSAPAPVTPPSPPPVTPVPWTEHLMSELPTLGPGSTGNDVRSVQGLLLARGYSLKLDGDYGPATTAAVSSLQHASGIAVDGITGPATWLRLHNRTS